VIGPGGHALSSILGLPLGRFALQSAAGRGVAESPTLARFGAGQVNRRLVIKLGLGVGLLMVPTGALLIKTNGGLEKRVQVVRPDHLIRGAWQTPAALRSIIARERIKTIVTLTPINRDDPKYIGQARVVAETGVNWLFVPMRGSRATLDQMTEAADLMADQDRQPVFFHCVAGHHRSSLAHAAYLIRHCGWPAESAWKEVANLPWARPGSPADLDDKALIEAFARSQNFVRSGGGTHPRGSK
jgi:protein tyrosine phosphatase (PTP) superfamily phosphohydrolase (DUF442 family)